MDTLDGIVSDLTSRRDAALVVFDGVIAYVKGIHGEIIRIAAEKDAQERLAATERARLKTETERSRKELDQLGIQIREAKRELERTHKQNEHDKRQILDILDNIMTVDLIPFRLRLLRSVA
jgi:hypothetical protein